MIPHTNRTQATFTKYTLLLLVSMFALQLSTRPAFAQEQDDESDATSQEEEEESSDKEDGEEDLEEGPSEDYEELDKLKKLEEEALQVKMLDSENWNPELLAPYRGVMASVRYEAGVIHELHGLPTAAPRGAALCEHPAVKARFDRTLVLGKSVPTSEPEIRAYLDFFDGRGKPTLVRWLRRMGYYEEMILETLKEEGLPEDLIYVAMIESGFSPTAKSHASAVGVWQFIQTTGEAMGLRIDRYVDERRDPVKATRAAAMYLQKQYDRYNSWPLALAAYNGGPGLMNKEIDRHNSNDYWFIARQRGMYDETRRYVPKVLSVALMAKNPDIFGLEGVIKYKSWSYDVVEVENPTKLSTIAQAISSNVKELRDLNPELRRAATPPMSNKTPYMLRIPKGKSMAFIKAFDKVSKPSSEEDFFTHEVKFGESLTLLSKHYGIKKRILRSINGLDKNERMTPGDFIIIPGTKKEPAAETKKDHEVVLVPAASFDYGDSKKHYIYTTVAGDKVEDIARAFGLNPADIAIWNAVDIGAKLREDMHLQLYLDADKEFESLAIHDASSYKVVAYGSDEFKKLSIAKRAARRKRSSGRRYHKVRPGQSLWTIARRHRTTVKKLKRLNPKLRRSNTLQPGDKIRVK